MSAYTPAVSFNFSVAKVAAILLVVSGHYFSDSLLWIPVTMGLFLFAYASGRFTSSRYAGNLSLKTFWWRKLVRLPDGHLKLPHLWPGQTPPPPGGETGGL